ncbi:phosphoribosylaminoimidazolesuccinocarboxamide synthase [Amnibacterium kyonggiense]|uniref:Phosphoribosylaminoimidazole-succinocarboxamide synthase n=1 Tax=Amnibacterium kyonggiense TaxID=595671 RepID=A0A4R7FQ96_9MICO|nr:phosphoribosylaminoimidazolesuccinocarboxamide synthase [Amnibacterium kyonggiense]TDS79945.1 phosphoribosylaminoimidazole-succinocarboxamide synthase [Amnibacterium kyonggiense]
MSTTLPGFEFVTAGKVRDLYAPTGRDDLLLLVANDRVSAFDQVLSRPIPGRAALLTALTRWWFGHLPDVPNHLADDAVPVPPEVADRAMLVRRLSMHPVECVVRQVVTGSGYQEYRRVGSISGVPLPEGLQDGDRLPEPIFTPAYKAELGAHDENIPFEQVVDLVGARTAEALRDTSLAIFRTAAAVANAKGVLLADTKFEFGDDEHGVLTLGDEVLTPDSSRYWDAAAYAEGRRGVSFDKQIIRDWLSAHWDGHGTAPDLPDEVVERTANRYRELVDRITG